MAEFTNYPNQIDTTNELPKATDNVTPVKAELFNRLRDAIVAIETELGIQPSSTFSTVKARLDALDSTITTIIGPAPTPEPNIITETIITTDTTPTIITTFPVTNNATTVIWATVVARNPADGTTLVATRRIILRRIDEAFGGTDSTIGTDFNDNLPSSPEQLIGTTDISSSGLYGALGSLDGKTLIGDSGTGVNTLTFSGAGNALDSSALLAAINSTWPQWTANLISNHLHIFHDSTGSSAKIIIIGEGTANTLLGLIPIISVGQDKPNLFSGVTGTASSVSLQVTGTIDVPVWNWSIRYSIEVTM